MGTGYQQGSSNPNCRKNTLEKLLNRQIGTFCTTTSKCAQENVCNMLSRWYMTPDHIATFVPSASPAFFWGCREQGTLLHIWWRCPRLLTSGYVYTICSGLFWILTLLTIHGKPSLNRNVNRSWWNFLVARPTLAKAWKQPTTNFAEVEKIMMDIRARDKITAILNNIHTKFLKIWILWVNYNSHLILNCSLHSL